MKHGAAEGQGEGQGDKASVAHHGQHAAHGTQDDYDEKTRDELIAIANEEEVDLPRGYASKEEVIRRLRAAKRK